MIDRKKANLLEIKLSDTKSSPVDSHVVISDNLAFVSGQFQ